MQHLARRLVSLLGLIAVVMFCGMTTNSEAAPAVKPTAQTAVAIPFDLTVSLEWTPGSGDKLGTDLLASGCGPSSGSASYLNDVVAGLRATSAYLYELSDGQMAVRDVTIYTGGTNWQTADIRILASNSTRPAAFPGGIVDTITPHTGANGTSGMFYPGTIFLGRLWDGNGSRCGRWSLPAGSRTIGHEWAHYALYLYDEYIDQGTAEEKYCTNVGPGINGKGILTADPSKTHYSAMAYQYTSSEIWDPTVADTGACKATPQWTVHGEADWETVTRFYPATRMPVNFGASNTFEGTDAAALFNPQIELPVGSPSDTSALARTAPMARAGMVGEAYMIRPALDQNKRPIPGRPAQIIGQGQIAAEGGFGLPYWGTIATSFDRAAVITQNWSNNARRWSFPLNYTTVSPLSLTAANAVTPQASPWQPSVSISPTLTTKTVKLSTGAMQRQSEVTGITVRVNDCLLASQPRMEFYLCPAAGQCGSPVLPPIINGARQWTFTFPFDGMLDPPASYGYVYIRVIGSGNETMAWYQLAGAVGPASIEGHAPLLDGVMNVDLPPNQPPPNNAASMVMFHPAQTCGGVLPAGILGIVGTPLKVNVAVANRAAPWGSVVGDPKLRVRLAYNQELVTRMELDEKRFVILRYVPNTNDGVMWRVETTAGRSTTLDWLATLPRTFSPQGEIFAIGYR